MEKKIRPDEKSRLNKKIKTVAEKIKTSKRLVVFTGAGISTESGIPDYRSQGGIWDKFSPVYFDEFMSSEKARIRYWGQRLDMEKGLSNAAPNTGHKAIATFHKMGLLNALITQNIDGLHQASGIPDDKIIELHGNTRRVRCMSCKKLFSWEDAKKILDIGNLSPQCSCSGFLKPDTISFGQAMPVEETRKAAILSSKSDVFIVVGSTLLVQPAALMPEYAENSGAFLVIINLSDTPYDSVSDVLIREKAGNVLQKIVDQITKFTL
ncbi:MAG: Sir2 family NAD-dependent protein deacetylase [Desulfobacula sp.]|nr:Sir2 family NAD-dependent protein deacetylase [Desulfobacula sp.]